MLRLPWFRCVGFAVLLIAAGRLEGRPLDEPRRVLLLHSFGRGFEPFNTFSETFRAELIRQFPGSIDFYDVALQSARFQEGGSDAPFTDYLLALFSDQKPDLVVSVGGPAARFVLPQRSRLFPESPLLVAAVDDRHVRSAVLGTNDSVVAVHHNPAQLLETIQRILPAATNIVIVFGASPLERFWVEEVRRETVRFSPPIRFTWMNDLPFAEVLRQVARLPPRSAIFFGQMSVDAAGIPHTEERALASLHERANAPIFGVHDFQLGRGIVGGPLTSVRELSHRTAEVAERILGGEAPSHFRPPPLEAGAPLFDWRELDRWSISESGLPPGSEVRFREPPAWHRYRWPIVLAGSAIVVQGFIISLLLANQSRRRRAEEALRESNGRLHAILDTAVEGIITINDQGRIESVNTAAMGMFGYSAEELLGKNVKLLIPAPGREEDETGRSSHRRTGVPAIVGTGHEVNGRRQDGSEFPIELAVSEVVVGNRRMFTGFVRDITERKAAERAAREFGGRLIRAQEEERARLARELHDDITQRLARLAIDAGSVGRTAPAMDSDARWRSVREGLVRLSEDVHSLSYRLHPAVLEDLGLPDALRAECDRFAQREGIHVNLKLDGVGTKTPHDLGLCLFRVTQEALRNVARHAHANTVTVSLRTLETGLQLAVTDDGAGFDLRLQRQRPSLGLASMRERVHQLGGELDVDSTPGQGTAVVAWLPQPEPAK